MPEMDGIQALDQIRSDSRLSHIPVLAVTGQALVSEQDKLIAKGFDAVLIKPVDLKDLLGKIRAGLTEKAGEAASGTSTANGELELSKEARAGISHITHALETEFKIQWETSSSNHHLPDIEAFATGLKQLGETYALSPVIEYSDILIVHVSHLDIEKIQESLGRYPDLVKLVKTISVEVA